MAKVHFDDNNLYVTAVAAGQTEIRVVVEDGDPHTAIVTVREGASDNGWL